MIVVTVFAVAAGASAMVVGFASGVLGLALPGQPSARGAAAVVVVAVALDVLAARGVVTPWSVRRQVPVEWSRLFEPPVVALLYGARLGVGPLTILPSWLWWGAFALGAWLGPVEGLAVGAAFALGRVVSTLGPGLWLQTDAPQRMARLRGWERGAVRASLALVAASALAATLLT